MAIHFNYIKGLNGDTRTLTGDQSDSIYTYIKWANRKDFTIANGKVTNVGSVTSDAACLPHIIVSKNNVLDSNSTGTAQFDCGHIITSNATNQIFEQAISVENGSYIYIKNRTSNTNIDYYFHNYSFNDQSSLYIGPSSDENHNGTVVFGTARVRFSQPGSNCDIMTINKIRKKSDNSTNYNVIINAPTVWGTAINKDYTITGNINESGVKTYIGNDGVIKTSQQVEALFFNATSDRRAKTHIQYWDTSALDIVTRLPIYEFHYKNNDTPSIGVIAQDAAEFDDCFKDFSLVDNATGENGDYMTIKESKLVYILWKAVQEQQEQIERLKAELREIKESL